jgi:hypothetical protein
VSDGSRYQRLQTFRHAQPAPGRQTRRCVQAAAIGSAVLVLPTAARLLAAVADAVASARGVGSVAADTRAIATSRSKNLGMCSSTTLASVEGYTVTDLARYRDNSSAQRERHLRCTDAAHCAHRRWQGIAPTSAGVTQVTFCPPCCFRLTIGSYR